MKRFLVLFAVLLFVVTLPAAAPPALDAQGNAAIGTFLKATIARGDVPGVVVLVTGPDRVLYHEAFGKMNTAQAVDMQKDAIFNIASMTKAVTSVGTMMLVEEGKLALDDEVSKYLPAFKSPKVISKVDVAAGTYETRPATKADHHSPVAHPYLGHWLFVVGSRTCAGAEEDRSGRSRFAARERTRCPVDVRSQHASPRSRHREDIRADDRRVPRSQNPRAARDARHDAMPFRRRKPHAWSRAIRRPTARSSRYRIPP